MTNAQSERQLATAIVGVIIASGLTVADLAVTFDSVTGTVTVSGRVPNTDSAQQVSDLCGSFAGVHTVDAANLDVSAT